MPGASAKPALLGPMRSDYGDTWTHTLVAEPYSPDQVRTGALPAGFHPESCVPRARAICPGPAVTSRRGRETHAHYVYGRRSGRFEHLAEALCKSPTDTLHQISRGHGVEGHEHVARNAGGLSR